jgi:hypothetical protein
MDLSSWRRVSCSHILTIRQPFNLRSASTFLSRRLLPAILLAQNSLFAFGIVPCFGQPCQKHPSTKIASLTDGNAKSGEPGSGRCRRQPVMPTLRKAEARASSVLRFRRDRTRDMISERLRLLNTSAIFFRNFVDQLCRSKRPG